MTQHPNPDGGVEAIDADGIMIQVAAVLGKYHASRGWKPDRTWNTHARQLAYHDAYRAEKVA